MERQARKSLEEAIGNLHVDIEHMKHVTMSALEETLAEGEPIDIFDYYGHGSFDEGKASLWMENESGGSELVPATKLKLLKNLPPLIVLHACNSAQVDVQKISELLILNLNDAGVLAVVAMQFEIRMLMVAQYIISTFYSALFKGYSLPKAVAEVRRKLFVEEQVTDTVSGFVPVLYMRDFDQHPFLLREQVPPPPRNPFIGPGAIDNAELFEGFKSGIQRLRIWIESQRAPFYRWPTR